MRKKGYIIGPIAFLLIGTELFLWRSGAGHQFPLGAMAAVIGACAILFIIRRVNHRNEPPDPPDLPA